VLNYYFYSLLLFLQSIFFILNLRSSNLRMANENVAVVVCSNSNSSNFERQDCLFFPPKLYINTLETRQDCQIKKCLSPSCVSGFPLCALNDFYFETIFATRITKDVK